MIRVDRSANDEKCDETGFKELSKTALTLAKGHAIKKNEDGSNRIDAFEMYDTDYIYDADGNLIENPNPKYLEEGTKIYINSISEDGYSFECKTEDGTEYEMNYRYI